MSIWRERLADLVRTIEFDPGMMEVSTHRGPHCLHRNDPVRRVLVLRVDDACLLWRVVGTGPAEADLLARPMVARELTVRA